MRRTIAIFSPNRNAYSETFIQAHKNLAFDVKYYYGAWLPDSIEPSGSLLHFNVKEKIQKKLNKSLGIWEHALLNSLKREKVECVLAEYGPTACQTLNVVKHLNLPLIVHFHGFDVAEKQTLAEFGEKYKDVFSYANKIVAVSEKMKNDLISLGCDATKIVVSICGPSPDFQEINPTFENKQFVAVGRFVDKKAPHITLEAFRRVTSEFPDARLVMVGDGPLLSICKSLTKIWKIEERVTFMGIQPPQKIMQLFRDSLAFVQHSVTADNGDSEGTPVAILEAQAAGLSVISTRHAGIPDVVLDNETGFLVDEFDAEAMAKRMTNILTKKDLAKAFGKVGKQRIKEHFTLDRHLKDLEAVINLALD